MIFVDTNILIDVLAADQEWKQWSRTKLLDLTAAGEILIVDTIVLSEIAGNFPDLDTAYAKLDTLDIEVVPIFDDIAFRAGQAFRQFRREHRGRSAILADFLVAGHAEAIGARLLTRDRGSFSTYFPDLTLITPESHP